MLFNDTVTPGLSEDIRCHNCLVIMYDHVLFSVLDHQISHQKEATCNMGCQPGDSHLDHIKVSIVTQKFATDCKDSDTT